MDQTQEVLFGRFPRSVGSPNQHLVHSTGEFDEWADTVFGRRNAYSSLSWFEIDGTPWCDKVSFDLDSAAKDSAFNEMNLRDDEKIDLMRTDENLADEVLGEVCEEARELTRELRFDGIPVAGVFSGFGLHIHALYQPQCKPAPHMGSTVRKYREELGLATVDEKPIGDAQRIMRVPNMKRVHLANPSKQVTKRWECDLWTIPLSGTELCEVTPEGLLDRSTGPRPSAFAEPDSRPEMGVHDDYTRTAVDTPERVKEVVDSVDLDDEGIEYYVRDLLKMPCMYENVLGDPEPPHKVRLNSAVLLFNVGLKPAEVADLFGQLGWRDYDRETTMKHLKHVYKKGYSDMNCETIQQEGYCTRVEDPENCVAHGWSGGEAEWT